MHISFQNKITTIIPLHTSSLLTQFRSFHKLILSRAAPPFFFLKMMKFSENFFPCLIFDYDFLFLKTDNISQDSVYFNV